MYSQNRGCAGLAIDDVDLQDYLYIPVREVASHAISEQLHVVRARNKVGSRLGAIAPDSGQRDNPTIGCGIAKPRHQRVIVGTIHPTDAAASDAVLAEEKAKVEAKAKAAAEIKVNPTLADAVVKHG